MATTTISIRIDQELKKQAEQVFSDLGLTMTAALTIFLKKAVREGGIPFALRREESTVACTPEQVIQQAQEIVPPLSSVSVPLSEPLPERSSNLPLAKTAATIDQALTPIQAVNSANEQHNAPNRPVTTMPYQQTGPVSSAPTKQTSVPAYSAVAEPQQSTVPEQATAAPCQQSLSAVPKNTRPYNQSAPVSGSQPTTAHCPSPVVPSQQLTATTSPSTTQGTLISAQPSAVWPEQKTATGPSQPPLSAQSPALPPQSHQANTVTAQLTAPPPAASSQQTESALPPSSRAAVSTGSTAAAEQVSSHSRYADFNQLLAAVEDELTRFDSQLQERLQHDK